MILAQLGRVQGLTAKVRGSLSSLGRLVGFATLNGSVRQEPGAYGEPRDPSARH